MRRPAYKECKLQTRKGPLAMDGEDGHGGRYPKRPNAYNLKIRFPKIKTG
jgi:hypothetical protein